MDTRSAGRAEERIHHVPAMRATQAQSAAPASRGKIVGLAVEEDPAQDPS
jgi:hypothetical protein